MRIAIYHNLSSGGAKRSLQEWARGLARRHQLDAFTYSCAEHDFADLRPHVSNYTVWPFQPGRLYRRPFGRLNQLVYLNTLLRLDRLDRALAAQIDRGGYDLVFVHHCRYRQSPGVLRFLRTPAVYLCHEPPRMLYDPPLTRPYERPASGKARLARLDPLPRLYRETLRTRDRQNATHAHAILVNSHHSQELIWRLYGAYPQVCYPGVDARLFHHVPCEREPILLTVGTVNPIKGHDLLIEGLARLPQAQRLTLVIVGNFSEARERRYIEQLAQARGVNLRIELAVSDAEVIQWYSRSRLTGFTPILEPLGLVPLESAACETPVLGVREGGVRETVLDGLTGRLVERDAEAVAQTISEMLADPEALARMGRQGRAWIEQSWNWEQSVTRLEQALLAVCASRSQGATTLVEPL